MSYLNDTVTGNDGVFNALKRFAGGYGSISNETVGSNVGDGTLDTVVGLAGAVTEVISLSAQAGGTVFDVTGSVSGSLATATVGTPYDNGLFSFTLTAGGIAFDEGDDFTFDTTIGEAKSDGVEWEVIHELNLDTDEDEMWLQGQGNSSDDAIYIYYRHFRDSGSGYYNIEFAACTAYDAADASDPSAQMGFSGFSYITLWQNSTEFWLVVNSQRIAMTAKINTNYMSMYQGWYLPEGFPSEHPLPLYIGGTSPVSTMIHTSTAVTHISYYQADLSGAFLRHVDGSWIEGDNDASKAQMYPWQGTTLGSSSSHANAENMGVGIGGGYIPIEANLYTEIYSGGRNSYGILDGIYYVSGFNNNSENTFFIGSDEYICFQNIFRTDVENFMAMRLT